MKIKFLILITIAILISSCDGQNENIDSVGIVGVWADVYDYAGVQNSKPISFPNIEYHILEDGSYTVQGDYPGGIHNNGSWIFEEEPNIVTFFPEIDTATNVIGLSQYFEWEILNLNSDLLEVNYTFKQDSLYELAPIEYSIYRKFERQ